MLYKVTPMMVPAGAGKAKNAGEAGQPRKRRKTAIYDGEGHEVLITLMCLKCKSMKPLAQFGLRKMADGAIRNQPWCRTCRSQAGTKPKKSELEADVAVDGTLPPPEAATTLAADPQMDAQLQDEETTQPMASQATATEQIKEVEASEAQEQNDESLPRVAEQDPVITK